MSGAVNPGGHTLLTLPSTGEPWCRMRVEGPHLGGYLKGWNRRTLCGLETQPGAEGSLLPQRA